MKNEAGSRLNWIEQQLQHLESNDLLRRLATRESPPVAGLVQIDGQQFINFGSNDYLGITASEEMVNAVNHYVSQLGWGAGASPLVNGRGTLHRRLEQELADFEETEAALLFPTGYAANVGTICSLVGKSDVVFSDELNHASIIDGCRLSGAQVLVYRHNDMDHLESLLTESKSSAGRRLIVTDGLFSMDGDLAPVPKLVELAQQFDAMLMVDEAHATGVFGDQGRGVCEHFGIEQQVDVRVGTLSKALGSLGGFIVGPQSLIDWVCNRARTYVFSTAQPEAIAGASLAALKIVREQPQRRERLLELANRLRGQLSELGFETGNSESQVIPILVGESDLAVKMSEQLRAKGIYIPAIRPPSVPSGNARLRVSLSSDHTDAQIDSLVSALKQLFRDA